MEEAALMAGAIINPREHSPARPTRRLLRRQQIIVRRMGIKDPPSPGGYGETPPPPPSLNETPIQIPIDPTPLPFPFPLPPGGSGGTRPIPANSTPINGTPPR
jgi:hypothetical protein